jgi:hypothetical protein
MMGAMTSPITGTDGNVEFLVHLRAPGSNGASALLSDGDHEILDRVVAQAAEREGIVVAQTESLALELEPGGTLEDGVLHE